MNDFATELFVPDKDAYWEAINASRRRQVLRIAANQGWLCYYCDIPLGTPDKIIREHRIPRSKGGRGRPNNIVASCPGCDQRKADRPWPPLAYIRLRRVCYYRSLGIWSARHSGYLGKIAQPGFGTDLDGNRLWAPQFGIV